MDLFHPTVVVYVTEPLVARALSQIISGSGDIELLGIASNVPELLRLMSLQPSVTLLTMTAASGLHLISVVQRESPGNAIVLWAHRITREAEQDARATGVRGILWRGPSEERILECIRTVHRGGLWFEPARPSRSLFGRTATLTPRETKLITLVAQGLTNQEIAILLGTTPPAVKAYLSRLLAKTGMENRVELALFGLRSLNSSIVSEPATVT